jgi:hypothetical protein
MRQEVIIPRKDRSEIAGAARAFCRSAGAEPRMARGKVKKRNTLEKGVAMDNGSITYPVEDITELSWEDMLLDPGIAPDVNLSTAAGCSALTSCGQDGSHTCDV